MDDAKDLSLQIDEALKAYFECLDDVLQIQEEVAKELKNGFFFMAKARYSMGAKAVSSLQYNTDNMSAGIKVSVKPDVEREEFAQFAKFCIETDSPKDHQTLRQRQHKGNASSDEDDNSHKERIIRQISDISLNSKDCDDSDTVTKADQSKSTNPLHWFGVLVPQSLRQSQQSFIKVSNLCIKLATAKSDLAKALDTYKRLYTEKQIVFNSDASELFLGMSNAEISISDASDSWNESKQSAGSDSVSLEDSNLEIKAQDVLTVSAAASLEE